MGYINGMGSLISLTLEEQYSLLIFEVCQIFQCIFGVFWGLFFKPCFEKVKKNIKVRGSRPPIQKHLRYLYIYPRDLKEEEG